jgi:hypothetical protein
MRASRPSLHAVSLLTVAVLATSSFALWACSSSSSGGDTTTTGDASPQGQKGDASSEGGAGDAGLDARPKLDATCDARIVECTVNPTQPSPTVNDPAACGAPPFDAYSTADNEQLDAMCNAFCIAQNPAYMDASGFVGCNQTQAEQALGTGAFHCVCAP